MREEGVKLVRSMKQNQEQIEYLDQNEPEIEHPFMALVPLHQKNQRTGITKNQKSTEVIRFLVDGQCQEPG